MDDTTRESKKKVHFEDGKMFFDKRTERGFYFILTMLVIVLAVLTRTGFFQ